MDLNIWNQWSGWSLLIEMGNFNLASSLKSLEPSQMKDLLPPSQIILKSLLMHSLHFIGIESYALLILRS